MSPWRTCLRAITRPTSWPPQRLQIGLVGLACVFLCMAVAGSVWPVGGLADESHSSVATLPSIEGPTSRGAVEWLATVQKRTLFEPAVPLPSRNVAKQSVEKIVSQLTLSAIMQDGGQYVAYIRVKGYGLKRLREGEGIDELFRITRIENGSVDLDVVGERVKLRL